ncbi:MAG: lipocalin-like domain-containing protein [Alphaproteobacteria bacterium]|nr:lipocalin-like domain-containing protein [Alphaproteobacteria bacterium]
MASIIGTWRLVSTRAWDPDGNPLPAPYGPAPIGMVTFAETGRMIAALCDGRTGLPDDAPAREYMSYMGSYHCDGATLSTRVDGTSDSSRQGSDQVRGVRWDGERLVLTPPPRPKAGTTEHRELTWERIA